MILSHGVGRRDNLVYRSLDDVARRLALATNRRTLLGLLPGSAAGSILPAHSSLAEARKKGKGKGKKKKPNKKKCRAGTRPCGKRCIPSDTCCKHTDCDLCSHELCESGQCGCTGGRVRHNGVCGFVPRCKSVSLTCTSDDECCSRKCDIPNGPGSFRCNKSTEQCIVDIDCLSGNCRGYMCPEFLAMTLDGVC
jgi:hypothetical protein